MVMCPKNGGAVESQHRFEIALPVRAFSCLSTLSRVSHRGQERMGQSGAPNKKPPRYSHDGGFSFTLCTLKEVLNQSTRPLNRVNLFGGASLCPHEVIG